MKLNDKYFLNPAHLELAKARYFKKDENGQAIEQDIDEVFSRVVDHIYKNDPDHKEEALRLRREKKIIDAGRPLAQAGTQTKNLSNCFVMGFEDDTREAISELKRKHFAIQAAGGGVGINFSKLRPNGSICKTTQSRSSGAVGFISDFSYQSSNVSQSGNRSGANMGVLEDWHPDLYEFITKKSKNNWENIRKFSTINDESAFSDFQWNTPYQWQMFNVSVFLSDEFMSRVTNDNNSPWVLKWKDCEWHLWDFEREINGKNIKITVVAPDENMARHKALSQVPYFNSKNFELKQGPYNLGALDWFDIICKNAWEDGCPGVIFIDMVRKFHNGEYFNKIDATNPCAELPLPVGGCCVLTSLVLPSFFENGNINWKELEVATKEAIRGLDNIIDVSRTGEKDIDENAINERRIGLGTTGIAELLILNNLKYSDESGRKFVSDILMFIRDKAYEATVDLAKERGAFPKFSFEEYSKSLFFSTLPKYIKDGIEKYGVRNVTCLTQPPVGTTGTMLGFSQGCEPYFAMCFLRNSRVGSFQDGSPAFIRWMEENKINYKDFNFSIEKLREKFKVPSYFEEAHEISWENHLKMQAIFSEFVDSSVSKTINLPNSATIDDVKKAYLMAYKMGIKSTTIYRDGSKQQILEHISKEAETKPTSEITRALAPKRPDRITCDIYHTTVKGEVWTVLVGLLDERPYEVFCAPQESFEISTKYKTGEIVRSGSGNYYLDTGDFKIKNISSYLKNDEHRAITRLISMCLRYGVPMASISDQLQKADGTVVDFSKAILRVLKKYNEPELLAADRVCHKCGSSNVVVNGGCPECLDCGASKCG